MPREIEEPVTTKEDGPCSEYVTRHPAYGQISASRVSGYGVLYDSEFKHQHYVTITIRRSEQHRSLSRDWHFGREELIEVALSEAQWASFVSSMNVGMGVPCTIQHVQRKQIPGLPDPVSKREQFLKEAEKTQEDGVNRLEAVARTISDLKISQKQKDELIKSINMAASSFGRSTDFVLSQFAEHMEATVEKAKIEVNAYATNVVQRMGLEALAGTNPLLEFAEKKDG